MTLYMWPKEIFLANSKAGSKLFMNIAYKHGDGKIYWVAFEEKVGDSITASADQNILDKLDGKNVPRNTFTRIGSFEDRQVFDFSNDVVEEIFRQGIDVQVGIAKTSPELLVRVITNFSGKDRHHLMIRFRGGGEKYKGKIYLGSFIKLPHKHEPLSPF